MQDQNSYHQFRPGQRPLNTNLPLHGQQPSPFSAQVHGAKTRSENTRFASHEAAWQVQNPLVPPPMPSSRARSAFFKPRSQSKRKAIIIGSIICILALLGTIAFSIYLSQKGSTDVTLYQVGTQNIKQDVGGGGIVYPLQQLTISYPLAERVISVLVKPGDHVSVNQSLIRLDPSQLNAQIILASNDMAAAQAYLISVSASGNPVTIAQAQQAYNIAKNKYNALVAETSSSTLQNGNLISPMNGVITSVKINSGEVFMADAPLITIMDESTVVVHVQVPLLNLGQVQTGQTAIVTPSALPNLTFQGTVSAIIPQADSQTDTFGVWVNVVNTSQNLLPGMSAFVHFQSPSRALVVPRLAVLNPDRDSAVFIVRNQQAYMQHVQVVAYAGDSILIGSGLNKGDEIVLVGLDNLQNGQKVYVSGIENQTT